MREQFKADLTASLKQKRIGLAKGWYKFSRNPLSVVGLVVLILIVLAAILAPYITPYPEHAKPYTNFQDAGRPPSLEHFFGTDRVGRDIFSRVIFGYRFSLTIGLVVLGLGVAPGVILGAPVMTKMTLDMGIVILLGATLSFIGLGVQPPKPGLGTMVAEGAKRLPGEWWGAIFPALAIVVVILAFNLVGDGLRDVFAVEEV